MRVALFVPCFVDRFAPQVAEATVRVLRRLDVAVDYSPRQTCCGQPAFTSGYTEEARRVARAQIELFPQRDYIRRIFVFEVRTLYGVPLVGNVFLFANVGMDALAKLGPGKSYRI